MIIGVDPGSKSGAIAFTSDDAHVLYDVFDLPEADGRVSAGLLAALVRAQVVGHNGITWAITERAQAFPKMGRSSAFNYGCGWGTVLGVFGTLGIPMEIVSPTKWKNAMGLSPDKERSRLRALELWPDQADRFKFKINAGRAEAALLCRWLAREELKPQHP